MKEERSLIPRGSTVSSLEMTRISCFFAAIVATRNGTEGSSFHVSNAMTTRIEMPGNGTLLCFFSLWKEVFAANLLLHQSL